jgi:DNA repair protein RecO (recombination protein O)
VKARGWTAEALVVREIAYGETSQVVHLATAEHGLVAALAKGSRRPGPEFQGGVPLGAIGEAALVTRRGSDLALLRRFTARADLRGLRADIARFYGAAYVLDLLRAWMRPELPLPHLFRAGTTALRAMASAPPESLPGWVVWFEARALAAGGHRPRLDACVACGGAVTGAAAFSPLAGGVVHEACAPAGPRKAVSGPARRALMRLYAEPLGDLLREPFTAAQIRDVRRVHDLFIPHLLERAPSSLATVPR